jgi:hypothetical protein
MTDGSRILETSTEKDEIWDKIAKWPGLSWRLPLSFARDEWSQIVEAQKVAERKA